MIKKIAFIVLICFSWFGLSAQSVQKRSTDAVTVEDSRVMAKYNLFLPRFSDTASALLQKGIDSCGALIFTYDSNKVWYRQCSPKKWVIIGSGGGSSSGATDSAAVLKQVTQISTFSRTDVNQLIVIDTIRGGVFYKYTGSDAADNGMLFSDANGTKWLRTTSNEDNRVNVQWFGARSYSVSDPHDSYTDIIAALNYMKKHPRFRTLYLPYDSSGLGYYYISTTININFTMNIKGDGSLLSPKSLVIFAAHTAGFVFNYALGQSSISNEISDLSISSGYDGTFDVTKHAIQTNSFIQINNVWVQQYDGYGLYITACATEPSGDNNNYGNASHSIINNFRANFCTNGMFFEGCDANIIYVNNADCAQNRRWGIYDNGMLGNTYMQPHFAFNGAGAIGGSKTVVTYAGKYYAALPGHDGYFGDATDSNYNKQPDINLGTYWQEVTAMTTTGAWSSSTRYYSGGTIAIKNSNAWGTVISPYSEGFQPPAYLNGRSYSYGGDNAAGVTGGIYINIFGGAQYMTNGNFVMPNLTSSQKYLTIGSDIDFAAPLTVVGDGDLTGSIVAFKIETLNRTATEMTLKNSTGSGRFAYGSGFFLLSTPTNPFFLGDAGFYPSNDATIDIGVSGTNRWRNVYATNYYGGGSNLTLSTTATTDTTTYKPLVVDGSGNQRRASYWYGGGGGGTSYSAGYGLTLATTTFKADSLVLVSWNRLYKVTDSMKVVTSSLIHDSLNANNFYIQNLGSGDTLAIAQNDSTMGIKSLIAGSNASFSVNSTSITINALSSYVAKTSTYTAASTDCTIDCTSGTFTINLPTAVGITGKIYNIKNTGTGTITIDPSGAELVDGGSTITLPIQYMSITIQSTGAGWVVL